MTLIETQERAEHSPLGGSGAYRWMVCPGSVQLSYGVEDQESDFAKEGTAAHELAELCLIDGTEPWMRIGHKMSNGVEVTKNMTDAVMIYINFARLNFPERNQGNTWVEREFFVPQVNEYMWGKVDYSHYDSADNTLHIIDYKHGAGIVVDAKRNPQLMYYAAGMVYDLGLWDQLIDNEGKVVMWIVQPRGFHYLGPIREYTMRADELKAWVEDDLEPSMRHAMTSRDVKWGEHCRFCPARNRNCPAIADAMKELHQMVLELKKEGAAEKLTNEQASRYLQLHALSKIVQKSVEQLVFGRLQNGQDVPGFKLGNGRVNRQWKEGAEAALKRKYGKKAYTVPVLRSPAQIEELPEGKKLSERWAYKPPAGKVVVPLTDPRKATVEKVADLFKDETK